MAYMTLISKCSVTLRYCQLNENWLSLNDKSISINYKCTKRRRKIKEFCKRESNEEAKANLFRSRKKKTRKGQVEQASKTPFHFVVISFLTSANKCFTDHVYRIILVLILLQSVPRDEGSFASPPGVNSDLSLLSAAL